MFEKLSYVWPFASSKESTVAVKERLSLKPLNEYVNPLNPEGLKPCCACPSQKAARDACFLATEAGEADERCREVIQAHLACMRSYGFKV